MNYESNDLFGSTRLTIADPQPVWQESYSCNCACGVCMAGDCCARPGRTSPPTYTSTTTGPILGFHQHDYAKFDDYKLFCRTCGETKHV